LQAAVLLAKVPYLAGWSAARRDNALTYSERLAACPGVTPPAIDPANDGRWLTPSLTVLAYLGRIENQSVRDAMALFAILRADRQQFSMRNQIANFTYIMRRVMIEQSIEDVSSIDANDLLFRIRGEVGKGLTDHQRRTLMGSGAPYGTSMRSMRRN
jgi:hypothetical protein